MQAWIKADIEEIIAAIQHSNPTNDDREVILTLTAIVHNHQVEVVGPASYITIGPQKAVVSGPDPLICTHCQTTFVGSEFVALNDHCPACPKGTIILRIDADHADALRERNKCDTVVTSPRVTTQEA